MRVGELLERATSMLQRPTVYWIGVQPDAGDGLDLPTAIVRPRRLYDELPADERQRYRAKALAFGVDPDGFSPDWRAPACDCASFVRWALRVPPRFSDAEGDHMDTTGIWKDAKRAEPRRFRPLRAGEAMRAGVLLVHPKMATGEVNRHGEHERFGHIGIVTGVDAGGRVTGVIHCAAENWLRSPLAFEQRNAIAVTPPTRFDERTEDLPERGTLAVWCRDVDA